MSRRKSSSQRKTVLSLAKVGAAATSAPAQTPHARTKPLSAAEVEQFLTHLAVKGHVSASTQNQAFHALLFLYQQVLEIDLGQPTRCGDGGRNGGRWCWRRRK